MITTKNAASLLTALTLAGCGGAAIDTDSSSEVGTAVAAISSVPALVACVRISLNAIDHDFTVAAGQSARLDLGAIEAGAVYVEASAFDVACNALTASTLATWVSEPITIAIAAGITSDLPITLRPNRPINANVDFLVPAVNVACGTFACFAVLVDGTVRSWGSSLLGIIGVTTSNVPLEITGLTGVKQVVADENLACALINDGSVRCWGPGYLGNGSTNSQTPVTVTLPAGVIAAKVALGNNFACVLTTDEVAYCWGSGSFGRLGLGDTTARTTPTAIGFYRFVDISLGNDHACGVTRSRNVLCWGYNGWGQFGNGSTSSANNTNPVSTNFRAVSALATTNYGTLAITALGTVRGSGDNANAQLGVGDQAVHTSPTEIANFSDVVSVSAQRDHACALKKSGLVYCWGAGGAGAIGDGVDGTRISPAPVAGLTDVVAIAAGPGTSCAVKADGSVWCWGSGGSGQLGNGELNSEFVPTRVKL